MEIHAMPIEEIFEEVENYSNTNIEFIKFDVIDVSADVIASVYSRFIIIICGSLFVFILNIGLSLWIGDLLRKSYYGFFVIASCYLLIAVFLFIYRFRWIINPIRNVFIGQMLIRK